MADFALRVHRVGDNLVVEGDGELSGQAGPELVAGERFAQLSARSRRLLDGGGDLSQAVALGRDLFATALPGAVGVGLRAAINVAVDRQIGLRIQVRVAPLPVLEEIAWELLHDGSRFLSVVPWISVVRYQELECGVTSPCGPEKLQLLFTTALPAGSPPLDLAAEEQRVRTALAPLRKWLHLTVVHGVSLSRLQHLLLRAEDQRKPFHIWHHAGHGGLAEGGGEGRRDFILELEEGRQRQEAAGAAVAEVVAQAPGLRVVVLNVCHGASRAGLAPALARLNVPAVVGFRTSVLDGAALAFASAFYAGLVHAPTEVAMGEARLALAYEGSRPLNWALPLLFSRTRQAVPLLAPDPPDARAFVDPDEAVFRRQLRDLMAALHRASR